MVDFSAEDVCSNPEVLSQLQKAFVDIGFVFITNHGIEKHKVQTTMPSSSLFICAQSSMPTHLWLMLCKVSVYRFT